MVCTMSYVHTILRDRSTQFKMGSPRAYKTKAGLEAISLNTLKSNQFPALTPVQELNKKK